MKDIFENAYFSKAYKTKDNHIGIVIEILDDCVCLAFENLGCHYYHRNGIKISANSNSLDRMNIVSEWKEEISEEELDELATNNTIANLGYDFDPHDYTDHYGRNAHWVSYKEGWKDAYRKVIEKYGSK